MNHLTAEQWATFQERLKDREAVPAFDVLLLLRKGCCSISAPSGTFLHEYDSTVDPVVLDGADAAARVRLIKAIPRPRRFKLRDIHVVDGVTYFRRNVLQALARTYPTNLMYLALLNFLLEVEATPAKFRPPRLSKATNDFLPLAQRHKHRTLTHPRKAWTPQEDALIRAWFGRHLYGEHKGKHVPLTEAQWALFLNKLAHPRTKNTVQARMGYLNEQLFMQLLQEQEVRYPRRIKAHMIAAAQAAPAMQRRFARQARVLFLLRPMVPRYMAAVLGERPRLPFVEPPRSVSSAHGGQRPEPSTLAGSSPG